MRPGLCVVAALLLVAFPAASLSQTVAVARAADALPTGSYPIAGSHLLQKENQEVADYVAKHPEVLRPGSWLRKPAWNFSVGSTNNWWSQTFDTKTFYSVASTCRAVGTNCYIFVEDALWGSKVTQSAVDAVANAFDNSTPANATKGIYDMDVEAFGTPPNIDGDARIVILILDVKDGYNGTGPYVAGYFWSGNEIPGYDFGNNAEIYYVDADPLDLTQQSGVTTAMGTTAHEFQHMIHWGKDGGEETFINEGSSCYAESHCGYGIRTQTGYVNETNHSLFVWRTVGDPGVLNDYSRAGRFFQYFADQFGSSVMMPIVASTAHGIAGLDAGLAAFGTSRRFADIFQDWLVANILDDGTVDPHYGYVYPNLPKAVGTSFATPNVPLTAGTVNALAAEYLSFTGGSDLRITFTAASPNLVIKAVEIGAPSRVLDVTPGVEFHEPGFGSTYSKIHFVVMNVGQSGSVNYSYQASGTGGSSIVELQYDNAEPLGFYFDFQSGDTACVWFDGVPGGRLDSIRVALDKTGNVNGGVYLFTGAQQPTPLGALLTSVTASRAGASAWAKIDLRAHQLSAASEFAVAFPYVGTVATDPRVQVVSVPYQSGSIFHSYTYYKEATPDNWYVLTKGSDSAWAYLIRAYVSVGATDAPRTVEVLPRTTRLEQNYPNPFNPSTTITYTVAGFGVQGSGASDVKITVYDMLGREVAVLVNERKPAGTYEVAFDGTGLASGVYVYRLTAGQGGSSVASRQMIMVK